jgi:hypothetical protein
MIWQDIAITICLVALNIGLVWSIRTGNKPDLRTCQFTAPSLAVITICFLTLGLWLSATLEGVMAVGWFILWFQQVRR